jgi:hypothetical protein
MALIWRFWPILKAKSAIRVSRRRFTAASTQRRQYSTQEAMGPPNYGNWTQQALVQRVVELENRLGLKHELSVQ